MKNKIFFIIFMIVWIIFVVMNMIMPKQTFSEQENRVLSKIPVFEWKDFMSGAFLQGVDDYINDHFVLRDSFLKLNSWWEVSVMGKQENNNVYIGKDGYLFEKFEITQKEEENIKIAQQRINDFVSKVEVPTYFLLIPNSIAINKDKLPENVQVADQKEIIQKIYGKTKTNNIDAYSILEKNKNLDLYFKTDHHLTSDGAYLLYLEYCKASKILPTRNRRI